MPTLAEDVRKVMKDQVAATTVSRYWAVPGITSEDLTSLAVGADILGGLASSRLDEVLVRSIVQIADALGMQTVAESVEDRPILQRITELGVRFAKGHVIARPAEQLPGPDFLARNPGALRPTLSARRLARASLARKR